jgi:hypothetical protein
MLCDYNVIIHNHHQVLTIILPSFRMKAIIDEIPLYALKISLATFCARTSLTHTNIIIMLI